MDLKKLQLFKEKYKNYYEDFVLKRGLSEMDFYRYCLALERMNVVKSRLRSKEKRLRKERARALILFATNYILKNPESARAFILLNKDLFKTKTKSGEK
ncbi:MAG: hypothetical protein ABDI07_11185, partial [Candidatus Kryptonium sp.]